jgi:hypothetical protein
VAEMAQTGILRVVQDTSLRIVEFTLIRIAGFLYSSFSKKEGSRTFPTSPLQLMELALCV